MKPSERLREEILTVVNAYLRTDEIDLQDALGAIEVVKMDIMLNQFELEEVGLGGSLGDDMGGDCE